jgi:hypothetical protein
MEIDYTKIKGVIEEVRDTDFVAGTIPYEVVCEDWRPYLPNPEKQKRGRWDTMSCVTFSALNVLETQLNFMLATGKIAPFAVERLIEMGYIVDGQFNFSERFTAVMSGTTDQGNSLQNVWDSIRHDGLLPERDCPYTDTMTKTQYFANNFTEDNKTKAKSFLGYIDIAYEWLIVNSFALVDWEVESIKKALKQSPLQFVTPVSNWNKNPCTPNPKETTGVHATMNWKTVNFYDIEDHYDPFLKQLSGDYMIRYAMKAVATLNDNIKAEMTNTKFVKDTNSDTVYLAYPINTPTAMESYAMNVGKDIKRNPDGSVDVLGMVEGSITIK